jgi:predicted CoA-binding protein
MRYLEAMQSTPNVRRILEEAKTIAVLGAHSDPSRPAHYVPAYLVEQGYRVVPVYAMLAGGVLFDETVRATLAEVAEPVDVVDVFRRAEAIPDHVGDILAMSPRPKVVWFQLGIRNDAAALELERAGIEVVQDRCTLADHRALGIPPKNPPGTLG